MPENRLIRRLSEDRKLLSIFVTAGFPRPEDTVQICLSLAEAGADLIELGIPFSDSIADGTTIQKANEKALASGADLKWTLKTLREIRSQTDIPVLLMGSLNPIMQYGIDRFCKDAAESGADGAIIPDLPLGYYRESYAGHFNANGLSNVFLITPNTVEKRLREIDRATDSFIYAVSMEGVTGNNLSGQNSPTEYLQRLNSLKLDSPFLVGFGIETKAQFEDVCKFARGGIIGSAFLRAIENAPNPAQAAREFVRRFK